MHSKVTWYNFLSADQHRRCLHAETLGLGIGLVGKALSMRTVAEHHRANYPTFGRLDLLELYISG
jgi:hypothetical protein